MARKRYGGPGPRMIWPQTIDSPQIRELATNPLHLIVWLSLYHGVCDQGRMEARVSTIQTLCLRHLPEKVMTPRVIQQAIARMRNIKDDNGVPLIYVYEIDGVSLLQIAKWWDWQYSMTNAYPSRWPPMPGWEDRFMGHGKRAFDEILADPATPDVAPPVDSGGTLVEPKSTKRATSVPPRARSDTNTDTKGTNVPSHDVQAVLTILCEEQGIDWKEYPGLPIQARHAKLLLKEGATPDKIREAMRTIKTDPYWANRGWNLATIRANWGTLMTKGKSAEPRKATSRPLRTIDDIVEPEPIVA